MKKILYCLITLFAGINFISCSDEDESVASQGLSVSAFYPTVVMDGTEVRVTGTGMTGVTEVVFPGGATSTDVVAVDDRTLKVVAPANVGEEEAPLILKGANGEASSRQLIRKANPTFVNYAFSTDEGAVTGTTMTISGKDLLLVDMVKMSLDGEEVAVPAILMARKTNDAIKFTIPDDAPIGDNVKMALVFKNSCTMELPEVKVVKGAGDGYWVQEEIAMYDGAPKDIGTWGTLKIPAGKIPSSIKEGDVIRVYMQNITAGAQGSLKCNADGWPALAPNTEYFDLTDEEMSNGYYDRAMTQEMIDNLAGHSLIISGQHYEVVKVTLFTSVWYVPGADLREPVSPDAIILNNYEDTGSHNAGWDGSWTSGVKLQIMTEDNGNVYAYLKTTVEGGEIWLSNCNHVNRGTVSNIENYAVKLDLKIDKHVKGASNAEMQIILGDNWIWYGAGFFPETTNEKWVTLTFNMADIKPDMTGDLKLGTKTNGLYGKNIPAGISFDNFRLEPIK